MSPKDRLIQSEPRFQGRFEQSVFQTLWFAYRPYKFWLALFFILGLIGRGLLLANANVIGWWVDSLCQGPACPAVPGFFKGWASPDFIVFLSALVAAGFLLTWVFRVGFSDVSAWSVSSLYDETTYRASRFPMAFFDRTPVGRIVTRFSSDYGNVFRLFGGPLSEFLSIVFDLFWMVVLTSVASPAFLPLLALMAVLNALVYLKNRSHLRECRRELSASRSPSIAHFSETVQGASTIRSFIKQTSFSSRFQALDAYYLQQKLRATGAIIGFGAQMNVLTAVLMAGAGVLALLGIEKGFLTLGSVGVAFGFVTLSGNTVQMFFDWLAQFEEAMVGVERMNHYLRSDLEPGARLPQAVRFPTGHALRSEQDEQDRKHNPLSKELAVPVKFSNVSFRYGRELPWIFEDLDFEIKAGEKFGIIGRTGSGKSSLIQALFHLYPLESGHITVGGLSPRVDGKTQGDLDLLAYRRSLAFIAQDPALFRGRLRDNLDVRGDSSDADMIQALKRVGLDDWAEASGLERIIEERGRNLSLGEKQLICLARCLLQNAPVVIMDEATSSIDPKSEELLVKATEEFFRGRTQIIIAHRLSTLRSCDRILWLQNGRIRKLGSPLDVLAQFEDAELA